MLRRRDQGNQYSSVSLLRDCSVVSHLQTGLCSFGIVEPRWAKDKKEGSGSEAMGPGTNVRYFRQFGALRPIMVKGHLFKSQLTI